jgi:flagella basal body P-ring formation protein FlgA
MSMRLRTRPLVLALTLSVSAGASAAHSLSDIATTALLEMERRAEAQNYQDIEVQIRPLDARLNLAQCGEPLRVLPENTQRALGPVSVGIRCDSPQPWTLYVRGQVSASATVPVMAASVGRGQLVGRRDVQLENRRISSDLGPIVTEIDDIIGKEARRNLSPGKTLNYADLRAPELIARGDLVTLVSGGGGLKVSMQGKAMASGAAGDRILVTNLSSGKRIEGVIAADGSVVLD